MKNKSNKSTGAAVIASLIVVALVGITVFSLHSLAGSKDSDNMALASVNAAADISDTSSSKLLSKADDAVDAVPAVYAEQEPEYYVAEAPAAQVVDAADVIEETPEEAEPVIQSLDLDLVVVDNVVSVGDSVQEAPVQPDQEELVFQAVSEETVIEELEADAAYAELIVYDNVIQDKPVYEEPVYEEPVYEEPVYDYDYSYDESYYEEPYSYEDSYYYEEPVYEEPVYDYDYTDYSYEEPVYEEPSYEEPVYEEPVYDYDYTDYSYEEPVYEEPVYEEPSYEEPVYEEPVYEEPSHEEPVYEEPSYEEPVYEEPSYEEPSYEEPVYEEPSYEEPVYEEPVYEEPSYEEPSYEEPSNVSLGQQIVNYASGFVGVTPYVWAGNSLTYGTDCSGFLHLIFADFGIYAPRGSDDYQYLANITEDQLLPGDVVVYRYGGHVALYAGGGTVIHASNENVGTVWTDMYWSGTPTGYVRLVY